MVKHVAIYIRSVSFSFLSRWWPLPGYVYHLDSDVGTSTTVAGTWIGRYWSWDDCGSHRNRGNNGLWHNGYYTESCLLAKLWYRYQLVVCLSVVKWALSPSIYLTVASLSLGVTVLPLGRQTLLTSFTLSPLLKDLDVTVFLGSLVFLSWSS